MSGWLVVNGFLQSTKFEDLYRLLIQAFQTHGVTLELHSGTDFTTPLGGDLLAARARTSSPDFVLFWDKDIALAHRLEDAGLPVFNSADAIACCDDKALTARALVRHAVPTPQTIVIPKTFEGIGYPDVTFLQDAADSLGLPFVLKEACGSFGQQVHLVWTPAEALDILRRRSPAPFVMQAFVAASQGRDLRVNVVGDEVVAAMHRTNATDFRSNVTRGGQTAPATPTAAQCETALAACRAVGADFAGVDILHGPDGEPLVCEVNSNPHFRSTLDCTGVNLADPIAAHVLRRLSEHP